MKRNNNKALYEKIMRNVSKEVKRSLNESNDDTTYNALLGIFEGLLSMVELANVGRNSSDFIYGAEDMALQIWECADFVCNCPPEILGNVIQDIIANT